jgi:hypothetical protein
MVRPFRVIVLVALLLPFVSLAQAPLYAGKTSEWLVTNTAGGSTLTDFPGRRVLELQNLGPNPIYCTMDGTSPVVLSNGRRILPGDSWVLAIGTGLVVKCIAATAAQVSTAATMVTELK